MHARAFLVFVALAGLMVVAVGGHAGDAGQPVAAGAPDDPLAAEVGKNCTVQLRRNLLGAASDKPVSATVAATAGGAEYAVTGALSQVSDAWVVVDGATRTYYIPRDAILLVEVPKK